MIKAIVLLAAMVAASEQAAVTVSVYYESLCPDSIRFINRQLYPTWVKLGSANMLVDFIPYGKATSTPRAQPVRTSGHKEDRPTNKEGKLAKINEAHLKQTPNKLRHSSQGAHPVLSSDNRHKEDQSTNKKGKMAKNTPSHHTQQADGSWKFSCQHGAEECKGNMMQACALSTFNGDQNLSNKFVHCAMSSLYPPSAGQDCSTELGVDYAPIKACQEGAQGAALLVAYGERTHTEFPSIAFVPTVAFDGKYSSVDQDDALDDLMAVVCRKLTGTKPPACSSA